MEDTLIIYHGSISINERPEFGKGNPYNDYGLGFYCTESLELAKEWSVSKDKNGFANKYQLNLSDLKILDLSSKEFNILHWISLLIQNRIFILKSDISKIGKKYLIENFSLPISDYDVIKGYRADDSYFSYADAFLNNIISVRRLSEALHLGNLGEQIVLTSEKAFDQLKFLGYEIAENEIYYSKREERNKNARQLFLNNKVGIPADNDLYLSDIIKGVDKNDPRIR